MKRKLFVCGILALLLTGWLMGCKSTPRAPKPGPAFSYVLKADNSLSEANFEVDILPLNSSTKSRLENVSLSEYFAYNSEIRKSAPKLTTFVFSSSEREKRLDLATPEFEHVRYPNYTHLAVLADIPLEVNEGQEDDPRRLLLPLDGNKWPRKWPGDKREITITITRALGIRVDPGWVSIDTSN